jgi:hypothetical protein
VRYLKSGEVRIVPIVHIQSNRNWYLETRYNYEEVRTVSVFAGKMFSQTSKLSYTITPVFGLVAGKFNGGSALNITLGLGNFYLSSQGQGTLSRSCRLDDFVYRWSELRYFLSDKIFTGFSLQQTCFLNKHVAAVEPEILAGLSFGEWSFPVYFFNPVDNNRYVVFGINWEWEKRQYRQEHKQIN